MSAELVAHKPHCSNHNLLQLFALVLCAPLPTRRKLRFHLCNSCISSLVFVVREPCVRSTSERAGWNYFARERVTRLSADLYCKSSFAVRCLQRTSDCYEVNRVSVAPRGADVVGSLKLVQRGNDGRGNT